MRNFLLLSVIVLLGCEKDTLDIQLAPHTQPTIVCEGYITDQNEFQNFKFTLSTNLGSEQIAIPDGVDLKVTTTNQIVSFTEIAPGQFKSDVPFSGIKEEYYKISFAYNGVIYQKITQMPYPVEINSITGSVSENSSNPAINYTITSEKEQYIRFETTVGKIDTDTGDTTWTPINTPIYRITPLKIANNQLITLPTEQQDAFYVQKGDVVKIKTLIIQKEVGEYLVELKDFINGALSNSKFYNPPYYFSNNAYGLAYGTIIENNIVVIN